MMLSPTPDHHLGREEMDNVSTKAIAKQICLSKIQSCDRALAVAVLSKIRKFGPRRYLILPAFFLVATKAQCQHKYATLLLENFILVSKSSSTPCHPGNYSRFDTFQHFHPGKLGIESLSFSLGLLINRCTGQDQKFWK